MLRHTLLVLVLTWCGCFRGLDALDRAPPAETHLALEVTDHNASVWDADNAPRVPVLTLRANQALGSMASRHLFMLRGAPNEETLLDLSSAELMRATESQQIALQIELDPSATLLRAVPASALEPGADYTLVWSEPDSTQPFALHTSLSPAAGARLAQTSPAELDARVPTNLKRVLLRFDGYLEGDVAASVSLVTQSGDVLGAVPRQRSCPQLGLADGDCIQIDLAEPLSPLSAYRIRLAQGLRDATGVALAPQEVGFRSAATRDDDAPTLGRIECAKDETAIAGVCALRGQDDVELRARVTESAALTLSCGEATRSSLGLGGEHAVSLPLPEPASCLLALTDLAGNTSTQRIQLAPIPNLAKVAIVEVRADPLGPEPSQEYVELLNFGDDPVALEGFTLTTDVSASGSRIAPTGELAPGERVLVVPPDFDAAESSDGAVPPGVHVARLERALSLRNDGSPLFLRDRESQRLSAAPPLGAPAGQCIARREDAELRTASALAFRVQSCTPGFESRAP